MKYSMYLFQCEGGDTIVAANIKTLFYIIAINEVALQAMTVSGELNH